ncbi:MAG: DoxX family protein [Gammaproteobacteria bacterium]|nr:DoxX family protein [Gammaproteobacteria bacterium]
MNNNFLDELTAGPSPTNMQIGYFFMRILLGINLFFHGFMRIIQTGGVAVWEEPMAATFESTFLPMTLVHVFLNLIPYIEVVLGAMTLLGFYTRWALLAGISFYVVLMFGHTVRQNWGGVHIVMHYGFYYWVLLALIGQNWLALDNRKSMEGNRV